jgi:N-methylhydantoinase A/oxoprolinase/acetone carboxylase beta subunit
LQTVAVLRVGAPSSLAVRPMFGWPKDLVDAVGGMSTVVGGGFEYDGREIVPFDADATRAFFTEVAGRAEAVAVDIPISLSHEIGSLGLLPRENATILNSALTGVARSVAVALTEALAVGACARHGQRFAGSLRESRRGACVRPPSK